MSNMARSYLIASVVVAAIATATVLTLAERTQESPGEKSNGVAVESTTYDRGDEGRASEAPRERSHETPGDIWLGTPGEILDRVAEKYTSFGRVDEGQIHWAPTFCSLPTVEPNLARFSESDDQSTHGRKLYFLFANDAEAYRELRAPQPVGQILVKESWTQQPMPADFAPKKDIDREYDSGGPRRRDAKIFNIVHGGYFPYAEKNGRWYRAGERAGLFVMMKLGTDTPETDDGWVYGTVDREGEATSLGRIASCMECHQQAEHDRLFGLPQSSDAADSYEMEDPDRLFNSPPQPGSGSPIDCFPPGSSAAPLSRSTGGLPISARVG